VTTSHQCCGSCTGCQFVSESRLRSRGSCISRSLVLLPRILMTTVIFSLMPVVARWGLIPTTSGSWSCHEHRTNLATGVSRLPFLDCGMTFHPGFGGRDFPSILLDDLWKHIFLATQALSDFRLIGAIQITVIYLSIYLSIYCWAHFHNYGLEFSSCCSTICICNILILYNTKSSQYR